MNQVKDAIKKIFDKIQTCPIKYLHIGLLGALLLLIVLTVALGKTEPHVHQIEERTVTEATCAVTGIVQEYCTACDYVKEKTIAPTEHEWDIHSVPVQASCEENGEYTVVCLACGKTENRVWEALGHNTEELVVSDATCLKEGEVRIYCTNCDYATSKILPKTKHVFGENRLCANCPIAMIYPDSWYYHQDYRELSCQNAAILNVTVYSGGYLYQVEYYPVCSSCYKRGGSTSRNANVTKTDSGSHMHYCNYCYAKTYVRFRLS